MLNTQIASKEKESLPWPVMAICGTAVAFDGYDLTIYGATLANLRSHFGLSVTQAGLMASAALVGMFIGAMCASKVVAKLGHKKAFLAAVSGFSLFTVACAIAPTAAVFAFLRFFSGLGFGVLLPVAAALTQHSAPVGRKNLAYVLMQSGYPIGGVGAALATMAVFGAGGDWRMMYLIGGLPLITVVPAALRWLTAEEPTLPTKGAFRSLLAGNWRRTTVTFWFMAFVSLLFVYGANTWLPAIMAANGHGIMTSLVFLFAFNSGGIVGGIVGGLLSDAHFARHTVTATFALGSASVLCLSILDNSSLLVAAAVLAGAGAIGTQTLINSWATRTYPEGLKTTGVGAVLGVGRIGGIVGPYVTALVAAEGDAPFLLFAFLAALGAAAAFSMGKAHSASE